MRSSKAVYCNIIFKSNLSKPSLVNQGIKMGMIRQFSSEPNSTKVILIGGSGFLGQYIAKSFIQDPFTSVQFVNRSSKSALSNLGNQILSPIQGDITNPTEMEKACHGADIVVNLVGIMQESKPNYTFDNVQHKGALNVANAANKANAKLIHISAIGADKDSDIPYNRTKGLGEQKVREVLPDAIIFRPSLVFGPEDDFFNRFAKLTKYLPFVPVFGGGSTKFQPVYVWDIARAVRLAANGPFKGKTFELGGPNVYTYKELMQLVLRCTDTSRPIISLPFFIGLIQGFFLEKLPPNLFTLTRDQVKLLSNDNIVSSNHLTFQDLGINPAPPEKILPSYLQKSDLTTKNKRTHKMQSQDLDLELDRIRKLQSNGIKRENAPNLEKQLEYHMQTKPKNKI